MFDHITIQVAVAVPLITAFIGYVTNWAAVQMIFGPKQFVGIGPIGWQGVIQAHNERFANDIADTVGDILSARELAERFDPRTMGDELNTRLDAELPEVVQDVLEIIQPGLWEQMAEPARDMVVEQVRGAVLRSAEETFEELKEISDELLDLRSLVVDLLSGDNVDRLVDLFKRMGRKELRFIVIYGGVFGFLVGLVQVALFGILGQWWLMPIMGMIVGLGTNWLAIQMIFRPMEPKKFAGIVEYQGMFPKRQHEIADEYGEISENEIFTPSNLIRILTEGEAGARIATVVLKKADAAVQEYRGTLEMLTQAAITDENVAQVQTLLVARLTERAPELREEAEDMVAKRLGVATMVRDRLTAMDKVEFERLLRGIFEEDEWILIVIGGFLGGLVGLLQGAVVLAA